MQTSQPERPHGQDATAWPCAGKSCYIEKCKPRSCKKRLTSQPKRSRRNSAAVLGKIPPKGSEPRSCKKRLTSQPKWSRCNNAALRGKIPLKGSKPRSCEKRCYARFEPEQTEKVPRNCRGIMGAMLDPMQRTFDIIRHQTYYWKDQVRHS